MEIKKGYKMTDVGVIPEDWEVKSIGEVLSICNGMDYKHLNIGNYPVYGTGGLIAKVDDYLFEGESVCIGRKGTIDAPIYLNEKFWTVDTLFYTINFVGVLPKFIYYLFNKIDWLSLNEASGVPSLSKDNIKLQLIQIPNLSEQQAIADALTKVDNLITSLTKVIEKKKLIKKGTMQKLLSGEMRLDGFEGEWIKIKLGDISSIKTGSRNVEEHSANGKYPFFVRSKEIMKINTFSYDEEAILVPGEGGIGEIFHYVNGKFDVHQRVYKISDFNDKVNALFIYWYMIIFFGEYAKENTVKATVDSLRLPTFTDFICYLPPTKAEQTAIADILTTMDNEIEALEKERDKYKCIKQGMMQQLLTGKIRLICQ